MQDDFHRAVLEAARVYLDPDGNLVPGEGDLRGNQTPDPDVRGGRHAEGDGVDGDFTALELTGGLHRIRALDPGKVAQENHTGQVLARMTGYGFLHGGTDTGRTGLGGDLSQILGFVPLQGKGLQAITHGVEMQGILVSQVIADIEEGILGMRQAGGGLSLGSGEVSLGSGLVRFGSARMVGYGHACGHVEQDEEVALLGAGRL